MIDWGTYGQASQGNNYNRPSGSGTNHRIPFDRPNYWGADANGSPSLVLPTPGKYDQLPGMLSITPAEGVGPPGQATPSGSWGNYVNQTTYPEYQDSLGPGLPLGLAATSTNPDPYGRYKPPVRSLTGPPVTDPNLGGSPPTPVRNPGGNYSPDYGYFGDYINTVNEVLGGIGTPGLPATTEGAGLPGTSPAPNIDNSYFGSEADEAQALLSDPRAFAEAYDEVALGVIEKGGTITKEGFAEALKQLAGTDQHGKTPDANKVPISPPKVTTNYGDTERGGWKDNLITVSGGRNSGPGGAGSGNQSNKKLK